MNTPRLFVGGPWHGRVVRIPSDLYAYRVPILATEYREASARMDDNPTATYELQTFASRETYTGVRLFVLTGMPEAGGYVLDAAARALGLTILEGPAL